MGRGSSIKRKNSGKSDMDQNLDPENLAREMYKCLQYPGSKGKERRTAGSFPTKYHGNSVSFKFADKSYWLHFSELQEGVLEEFYVEENGDERKLMEIKIHQRRITKNLVNVLFDKIYTSIQDNYKRKST